ncbi:hypothetical protein BV22DRAFT_440980 [Leucogyrophana mollusca]|uniref:Uncharacterized protein n=1 Tax=Leucogyrophana mollusca TaxID=85980 RepID=A0ACB8BHS4_9AGAM|nr:hypothetical protein BV22DRAFT_440980 [Leucogyrophana mollusca]
MSKKFPKVWKGSQQKSGDTIVHDAKDSDIIIPIMGTSGVGKSFFFNTVVGDPDASLVGHGLESCTANIQHWIVPDPDDSTRRIVFVDTPGFDGTDIEDSEILRRIAVWLTNSYSEHKKLAGIIYLQEIFQCRDGWSGKAISQIRYLCGEDSISNVVLATTKWTRVTVDEGERRERQLSETWKPIGTRMARFHDTRDSAWGIVNLLTTQRPIDNMILILGQSGAGKSTFINVAAGREVTPVGHGLDTCTTKIRPVFVQHPTNPKRRIVFIDTPGFNDARIGDTETLRSIVEWLHSHEWLKLTGIIYLQEITQTRIGPANLKDFMSPQKLSHPSAANNIVLATTRWDEITEEEGQRREHQRSELYRKDMFDQGSHLARFMNTHESAWEIVNLLLQRDDAPVQQELSTVLRQVLQHELSISRAQPAEKSQAGFIAGLLSFLFGRNYK